MDRISAKLSMRHEEFYIDPNHSRLEPFLIGTTLDGITIKGEQSLINGSSYLSAYKNPSAKGLAIGFAEFTIFLRASPQESKIILRDIKNETESSIPHGKVSGVGLALIRGLVALATAYKVSRIVTEVITNHGFFALLGFSPLAREVALSPAFPLQPPFPELTKPEPLLKNPFIRRSILSKLSEEGVLPEVPETDEKVSSCFEALQREPPKVDTATLIAACQGARARASSGQSTGRSRAESGGLGVRFPATSPTSPAPSYDPHEFSGSGAGRSLSRSESTPLIVSLPMVLPINPATFLSLPKSVAQLRALDPTISSYVQEALEVGLSPVCVATAVSSVPVGLRHIEAQAAAAAASHPEAPAAGSQVPQLRLPQFKDPHSEGDLEDDISEEEDTESHPSSFEGGWDLTRR